MKPSDRIKVLAVGIGANLFVNPDSPGARSELLHRATMAYLDEQQAIAAAFGALRGGRGPDEVNQLLEEIGVNLRVRGRDLSIDVKADPLQGGTYIPTALQLLTAELRAKGMM